MSNRGDTARLAKVMKYIMTIEHIIKRFHNTTETLKDIAGQPALLMCLMQIGELLNRIHEEDLREKLEVRKIVAFRNILVHEYDSVLIDKVQTIIQQNLPELKNKINKELEGESDYHELKKLWEI